METKPARKKRVSSFATLQWQEQKWVPFSKFEAHVGWTPTIRLSEHSVMQDYNSTAAGANKLQAENKADFIKLKLDLPLYTTVGIVARASDWAILQCTDCI